LTAFEAINLISGALGLDGGIWDSIGALGENSGYLGFAIIGGLVLCWIASLVVHRWAKRPGGSQSAAQ
jgi:high-affinity nickel-transport protein